MNLYERSLNYLFNHFGKVMPDSILLRVRYRIVFHEPLHLKNPKTFNEKIQVKVSIISLRSLCL